jgi:hypothetical protein
MSLIGLSSPHAALNYKNARIERMNFMIDYLFNTLKKKSNVAINIFFDN